MKKNIFKKNLYFISMAIILIILYYCSNYALNYSRYFWVRTGKYSYAYIIIEFIISIIFGIILGLKSFIQNLRKNGEKKINNHKLYMIILILIFEILKYGLIPSLSSLFPNFLMDGLLIALMSYSLITIIDTKS